MVLYVVIQIYWTYTGHVEIESIFELLKNRKFIGFWMNTHIELKVALLQLVFLPNQSISPVTTKMFSVICLAFAPTKITLI